jgi:uncharacterized repeat protein (TIGR01451 family)
MKRFATGMTMKLTIRAAIALVVASAGATWCLATPSTDVSSVGPLTHVWVGKDLSCQAQHIADAPNYEFYPAGDGFNLKPGDYGTFIAMNGMLYAPDFGNHDLSGAYSIGYYTPFTQVSQTAVTGAGATANPFKVVTVVDVADTGLQIQQTDTYVVGDEFFTTEILINNNGTDTAIGILYRAFDAFLGGDDHGYGFATALSDPSRTEVGCLVNANNSPPGKIEALIPLTGGNNYVQGNYDGIWSLVGSQAPFPDFVDGTYEDNGAGISWNFSIPAGSSKIVAHTTLISSPEGLQPLVTSKTADSPQSLVGTQNGYTITITNPNAFPVAVSSITDTLPAGFTYVGGSTDSATTNDPAINGQTLTWSGPFTLPGGGSVPTLTVPGGGSVITLHFKVTVASTPGDYFNEAGGSATGAYKVIGTGPTAKITVTAATPTSTPTSTPTATATAAATSTPSATPTPTATIPPTTSYNYCTYAVFGLNNVTLSSTGGATGAYNNPGVTGDVAIGGGTGSLLKSVINGRVFVDSSAHPDIHSDFSVTGGVFSNQNLSGDKTVVLALSAQLAAMAPTQTFGDITGDLTISRTAQLNVIRVNLVNLTKKTLTLNGHSTDTFIINVTSPTANFVLNNSKILLSGGLTANHVTVNFPGTGGSLSIYKASTVPVVNGTILAPQRDIVIDNPPVLGSVIGSTIDIHSGAKVTGIQCP